MLKAENYLKEYYSQYPNDIYSKFLQSFGCWMYYDTIYNEIKKFNLSNNYIESFENIIQEHYSKNINKLNSYKRSEILKSIIKTNQKQYNEYKKDNFILSYYCSRVLSRDEDIDRIKGIYNFPKTDFIINKSKDITKRTIVLFFKNGDRHHTNYNNSKKVGVDIFQLCVIYKIIKKLIDDRYLKNFNDVIIIPKFEKYIPEFFIDLDLNIKICNHTEYLNECCLYANPFYFYGNNTEACFAHTKSIICSTILIQRPYSDLFKDYFYMPFYYTKGKIFNKEIKIDGYDGDPELSMKWGEKGHNYCKRMMKHAKNNSLESLISTLINRIVELDNSLN